MKSVLHELYKGNIYPAEHIVPKDPEYRPLNRKIGDEKELLKKKLSEDDIERLSQLEDMYTRSTSMEERQSGLSLAHYL